ncbi:hypothetical protein TRAPUB_5370 [Trametes pubescens]|uniref:Uncharacterized protein n=1 Tax=Trametes pubescens TaxID=154538 RepID=A0A1M2V8K1_TRAPU|nr:hypothetical protein TRAPUB_5370 [Trametes pubescens]
MDPDTSIRICETVLGSASVSPTTQGVSSQEGAAANEAEGRNWSDWDSDGSDEEHTASTVYGAAQLKLEHTSLSPTTPAVPLRSEFIVHIEGLREDTDEYMVREIVLPSTIEDTRAMTAYEWDTCIEDIRDVFGNLLQSDQKDALNTMAAVYLWFSRTSETEPADARDVPSLWNQLQDLLMTAAVMGTLLQTPGEDLIRNVEGWARANIAEAFSTPVSTSGPGARADATAEEPTGDLDS